MKVGSLQTNSIKRGPGFGLEGQNKSKEHKNVSYVTAGIELEILDTVVDSSTTELRPRSDVCQ